MERRRNADGLDVEENSQLGGRACPRWIVPGSFRQAFRLPRPEP